MKCILCNKFKLIENLRVSNGEYICVDCIGDQSMDIKEINIDMIRDMKRRGLTFEARKLLNSWHYIGKKNKNQNGGFKMAKAMKQQDAKNYNERCRKNQNGESSGLEQTDISKILAIKWDLEHGYYISPQNKKILEDWEKRKEL